MAAREIFIHTRANGFRSWVCVDRVRTVTAGRERIAELKQQDDPMWAAAEYLLSTSRKPHPDAKSL